MAAVHPRTHAPARAELVVAAVVVAVVLMADVRGAIGFSSVNVLTYYAIANVSALTLSPAQRRWPRWWAGTGLAGCLFLTVNLPVAAVAGGGVVLGSGAFGYLFRERLTSPGRRR